MRSIRGSFQGSSWRLIFENSSWPSAVAVTKCFQSAPQEGDDVLAERDLFAQSGGLRLVRPTMRLSCLGEMALGSARDFLKPPCDNQDLILHHSCLTKSPLSNDLHQTLNFRLAVVRWQSGSNRNSLVQHADFPLMWVSSIGSETFLTAPALILDGSLQSNPGYALVVGQYEPAPV